MKGEDTTKKRRCGNGMFRALISGAAGHEEEEENTERVAKPSTNRKYCLSNYCAMKGEGQMGHHWRIVATTKLHTMDGV